MTESILQTEQECFLSGGRVRLDRHHIYGGPNRDLSERWGCWVWLRRDLHRQLHDRDPELKLMLKRICQERFEELYDHETFMKVFGKNYLEGETDDE